ncbi:bile acid:sodium symporter family protein [Gordonia sp. CPCC 205333]|uniref:bile acid:sodium symporter family protein n=1 Tax=Gordonia sp. CPCC 205333 TaxID=3140790 RepID=UPI003AF3D08A
MTDSALITTGLPVALAIIMFGLGLSLTLGDFRRVARTPKAVAVALFLQVVILPMVALTLILIFDVEPLLAVGLMLLAASPGGTTASLFSHLFRGDVALNITLTAINSVLAVITIPVFTNFAIGYFDVDGKLGLQFGKISEVLAFILIPVVIGMFVRTQAPKFALRMDRPVRIFSIVILATVSVGALIGERDNALDYLLQIGLVTALFCLFSLTLGYLGARILRLDQPSSVASSMEVGIHNTTVALTVALSVLENPIVAIPSAVYSVFMYPFAAAFGYAVTRERSHAIESRPA